MLYLMITTDFFYHCASEIIVTENCLVFDRDMTKTYQLSECLFLSTTECHTLS